MKEQEKQIDYRIREYEALKSAAIKANEACQQALRFMNDTEKSGRWSISRAQAVRELLLDGIRRTDAMGHIREN